MRFIEQFELLKMLHEDVSTTWLVVEKASGRRLLLHKCPKESKLRGQLLSMPPDQLIKLIAAGEDERSYLVVTHDLPELRRFRDWVESGGALAEPAKTTPYERPVPATPKPGEFTRMFSTPVLPNEPKPSAAEPPVLRNEPKSPKPGEFTRMFSTPVLANEPKPSAPEPPVLRNEPKSPKPGEFTRMFSTPVLPNEPKPSAPEPPVLRNEPNSRKPGEFTKMFSTPVLPNEPKPSAPEPPVLRNEPKSRRPGEFTRMFSTPVLPNEPKPSAAEPAHKPDEFTSIFGKPFTTPSPNERGRAQPSTAPSRPPDRPAGDFTRVFGSPNKGPTERPSTEHATGIFSQPKFSEPAGTQPSEPAGPSEYTRIIRPATGTGSAQEAASQPVAPPPKPAVTPEKAASAESKAASSRNLLPLVIILGLLVIAAIGMVVYFVMKR